jgi:hypothetical protein
MVIAVPDTPIDENTMMVSFGDAITAYTAVLRSGRLSLPTCFTHVTWNKEVIIVRIETAVYVEVFLENIAWVHGS